MTTRTDGVGTPKDTIPHYQKVELGEIKKLSSKQIELFKKQQVHGEMMQILPTKVNFEGDKVEKQLKQLLEAGTITQKEYDAMMSKIAKE